MCAVGSIAFSPIATHVFPLAVIARSHNRTGKFEIGATWRSPGVEIARGSNPTPATKIEAPKATGTFKESRFSVFTSKLLTGIVRIPLV